MASNCDPAYRRLSGSPPAFRRTKSVRASFRALGARWKPMHNKAEVLIKSDRKKDIVMERFGKELNESLKSRTQQSESFLKGTSKIFGSFAKENVPSTAKFYDLPDNVAPKAAALLQIPLQHVRNDNNKQIRESFHIDHNVGNLIVNSQQFNDLKKSSADIGHAEKCRTATVRRAPYWTNNLIYSKIQYYCLHPHTTGCYSNSNRPKTTKSPTTCPI